MKQSFKIKPYAKLFMLSISLCFFLACTTNSRIEKEDEKIIQNQNNPPYESHQLAFDSSLYSKLISETLNDELLILGQITNGQLFKALGSYDSYSQGIYETDSDAWYPTIYKYDQLGIEFTATLHDDSRIEGSEAWNNLIVETIEFNVKSDISTAVGIKPGLSSKNDIITIYGSNYTFNRYDKENWMNYPYFNISFLMSETDTLERVLLVKKK